MKHYILLELASKLNDYHTIKQIKRVENNTIRVEFNGQNIYYFNLSRGNSLVYKKDNNDNIKKDFNAPFDVILKKRFVNAKIIDVYLLNNDKIMVFKLQSRSSYKTQTTFLQLEFTGKNTNIIVLDEKDIVLEALRHIDEWSSVRVVQTGLKLQPLEKPDFNYEEKSIENIDVFLLDIYKQKQLQELNSQKKQKLVTISKNIKKIQDILNTLDDLDVLEEKSINYNNEALTIVSNLYNLSGYEKSLAVLNSNTLFKSSKKMKQKIKNQHKEKLNLSQKIEFFTRLENTIQECKTIDEIEFFMPKKDKNQKQTKKAQPYQSFFIDGYKIMLGRDERENIYLLQNSKASDYWFHLQEQVSSHVIVSNTKKTIPKHIIDESAKICARFSVSSGGVYTVDFTQRRNVKIQHKANVLYNPYSSVTIKI